MNRELHQLRLAEADRHVAEARKRIAVQRAAVEAIEPESHDAQELRELLALSEEALRLMLAHREFIAWVISD